MSSTDDPKLARALALIENLRQVLDAVEPNIGRKLDDATFASVRDQLFKAREMARELRIIDPVQLDGYYVEYARRAYFDAMFNIAEDPTYQNESLVSDTAKLLDAAVKVAPDNPTYRKTLDDFLNRRHIIDAASAPSPPQRTAPTEYVPTQYVPTQYTPIPLPGARNRS